MKYLIIILSFISISLQAQEKPVKISNPYEFQKYVKVKKYIQIGDTISADSVRVGNLWLSPNTNFGGLSIESDPKYSADSASTKTKLRLLPKLNNDTLATLGDLRLMSGGGFPLNPTTDTVLWGSTPSPASKPIAFTLGDLTAGLSNPLKNGILKAQGDSTFVIHSDSVGTGRFNGMYYGTQNPTKTTRVNLNGHLYATNNSSGTYNLTSGARYQTEYITFIGGGTNVNFNIVAGDGFSEINTSTGGSSSRNFKLRFAGGTTDVFNFNDPVMASTVNSFEILRNHNFGTGNATANFISITDNPTTSGTISGKILSATIGTIERISLNPRVADGSSAVAYIFDTHNSLSNPAARLLSIRNQGGERLWVDVGGSITCTNVNGQQLKATVSANDASYYFGNDGTVTRLNFNGNVSDGATVVAYYTDTKNLLTTAGAKLWSFRNNGTEKAFIDKDGNGTFGGATNNVEVSNVTGIRLNGTATAFDEIQFDLNSLKVLGTTSKPDYDLTSLCYLFPQNDTTEIMGTSEEMTHWWKEGSSAYFMIHFDQTQNLTPVFRVQYKIYNVGDAEPATWSLVESNSLATSYTSGTMANIAKFPAITLTGKTIGATLKVRMYRKDNVYTGDCKVTRFGLHLEKDALGSNTEYSKN